MRTKACHDRAHRHATLLRPAFPRLQASTLAPTASPSPSGNRSCAQLGWDPRPRTTLVCAESEINGICHEGKTYPEAQAICSYVGARLCTEPELDDDVGRGSGCRDDRDKVWTSSTCGDDGGFVAMSSGSRPSRECSIPTRTSHQVKCCADVVTAHPTAHPTAAPSSAVPTTLAPTPGPTAPPTCAGFSELHPHGLCHQHPTASSRQIDGILPAACRVLCAEDRACVAFETHGDEEQARECIIFSGTAPTRTERDGSRECYVKEPACFLTTAAPVMSTSAPPSRAPTAQPTGMPITQPPSGAPTAQPTVMPTTQPPTTVAPTVAPTAAPTSAPSTPAPTVPPTTMQPTVSGETHGPTHGPTVAPTSIPTSGGAPSAVGTLDAGNNDAGGVDGGGSEDDVGAQFLIVIVVSAAITASCGAYVVHVRKRRQDRLLRPPPNRRP